MSAHKSPIHVGDRFQSGATIYIVTEVGRFGAPNWVVTEDRRRQGLFHHHELRAMTRLPSKSLSDSDEAWEARVAGYESLVNGDSNGR